MASVLGQLFAHNLWANTQIMDACAGLRAEQLDQTPMTATLGSIRETLVHLVEAEQGYLRLLGGEVHAAIWGNPVAIDELRPVIEDSGQRLLDLAEIHSSALDERRIRTRDGYWVVPWVVLLQVINHATEHREQVNSMLTALGRTPPVIDGWSFGETTGGLRPVEG